MNEQINKIIILKIFIIEFIFKCSKNAIEMWLEKKGCDNKISYLSNWKEIFNQFKVKFKNESRGILKNLTFKNWYDNSS